MFELSLQQILMRLVAFVVITGVHGLLVALFARLLGDRGPAHDGKLTINPFVHLDLLGLVAAIFTQFGWIRPVDVESRHVRGGVFGQFAVAVLALAATLGIAWVIWTFRSLAITLVPDATFANGIIIALRTGVEMTLPFVLLNIVPVPPLTMGIVLEGIAPKAHAFLTRHGVIVRLVLLVLAFAGALSFARPALAPLRSMIGM